jgi:predicted NBD/HSP70 family sugar kinase
MAQLSFDDILRLASRGDARALKAIDRMADHLAHAICMVVCGLAPEILVVVGEVTRLWERVGPRVDAMVSKHALARATTRILPANPDAQPRLRGTIALVLQEQFGTPFLAYQA